MMLIEPVYIDGFSCFYTDSLLAYSTIMTREELDGIPKDVASFPQPQWEEGAASGE